MSLPIFQSVVVNDSGDILPNAQVQVRGEIDGGVVSLYANRDATGLISAVGDMQADEDGFVKFFAWPDRYQITITSGGFSRIYNHVQLYPLREFVADVNTSRTLQRTDAGNIVRFYNDSPIAVTVPNDTTLSFPVFTEIALAQLGNGIITVSAELGATIQNPYSDAIVSMGPGSTVKLVKIGGDTWFVQVTYDRLIVGNPEIDGSLRVDNVQIDDSEVSTLDGGLDISGGGSFIRLKDNTTVDAHLTVTGDFTVQGTPTHIESTVVEIGDNIIELNSGETGAPSMDAGFEVQRGTSANVRWLWDETNDAWSGGGEKLRGIADPTTDDDVGDRRYNDSRYREPWDEERVHLVTTVIRYYSALGRWEAIGRHEVANALQHDHDEIGIDSIASDSSSITINFDTSGWGSNVRAISFLTVLDEQLAGDGVFLGSSVGLSSCLIDLYKGPYTDFIQYDGASWVATNSRYSMAWDTDHLVLTRDTLTELNNETYPTLTARQTPYQVTLGSVGPADGSAIEVYFYDASGTLVTTPDTDMKFFISDPARMARLDPNSFPDEYGNIWIFGVFRSDS